MSLYVVALPSYFTRHRPTAILDTILLRAMAMLRLLTVLGGLTLVTGCGGGAANRLDDDPDQLVLYSIDGPTYFRSEGVLPEGLAKGELLHGYPVLGKVEISDPEKRRAVVSAIKEAVRKKPEYGMNCFIPRHAVRSVKGGEEVVVLICFQCRNYEIYRDGEPDRVGSGLISQEAKTLLNATLADAGVRLAAED